MCRLLGAFASRPVDLERLVVTGPRPFRDLGGLKDPAGQLKAPDWAPFRDKNFHPDGWGLGWYEGGTPHVRKRPEPAAQSTELPALAAKVRSKIIFCHVRKASHGEKSEKNCHPFVYGKWLFAHNGTVERPPLVEMLDQEHRAAIRGTTDSEVFFHCLLQAIKQQSGDPEAAICDTLGRIRGHEVKGLNFLLSDEESLFAFRYSSKEEDYYSLRYIGLRKWSSVTGTMAGNDTHTDTGGTTEGLRAVLLCSEKLIDGDWEDIPSGHLLAISPQIEYRLTPVFEGVRRRM